MQKNNHDKTLSKTDRPGLGAGAGPAPDLGPKITENMVNLVQKT